MPTMRPASRPSRRPIRKFASTGIDSRRWAGPRRRGPEDSVRLSLPPSTLPAGSRTCPGGRAQRPDVECRVLADSDQPSLPTRIGALVGALLLGVAPGAIGTFAHQSTWPVLGIRVPLGLITPLIAVGCLVAGLRLVLGSRLHAGLAAAGIIAAIGLLALAGPSGSPLLPANPARLAWTIVPAFLIAIVLGWPNLPARRDSAPSQVRWNTDGGEDSIQ